METLANKTALVVDDNPHSCRLLSSIVSAMTNAEVRCALCPREAYTLLPEWQPNLILTDYHMTPVDGVAFAEELRTNAAYKCRLKPILLMTAETPSQELVERVRDANIDAMITKPIVPETLAARLNWAQRNALSRANAAHSRNQNLWIVD